MTDYTLSILVPSWNGACYIENCLDSLLDNDYPNYKIISIAGGDDNCYDITRKYQERYPDKVVALQRRYGKKNEALNLGLKKVQSDIIIITDVDCNYPKNWLSTINQKFQDKTINVITGLNLPYQHHNNSLAEFNRIRIGYTLISFKNGQEIIGNKLWGGNSAFRSSVFFQKIEEFETESITGDDKILGMEFNRQGESVYFFRDIYVFTEHYSDNLKKYILHRVRWARDLFIDLKKRDIFKIGGFLAIASFKLFYPIIAILIWLILFFNSIPILLLLTIPWLGFYLAWMVRFLIELRKKQFKVNTTLNTSFNYKKAFKIVPLMFFVYSIISLISFINPKGRKWYH